MSPHKGKENSFSNSNFFKWLKGGKGILGAEYKNVIKAVASNHSH
jgi:hypothetical protein